MEESGGKNFYAIIPAFVRYDDTLTPNAKLLYGEITALCNEYGFCWASNEYFSNLYNVSKTSVSKWINSLVRKKYLSCEIIYKEGTKEIDKRKLSIINFGVKENFNTPLRKVKDPIEQKLKDNNTIDKNKEIYKESFTDEDFDLWFSKTYEIYPRKSYRVKAKAAYKKKLRGLTRDEAKNKANRIYILLKRQIEVWNRSNGGQGREVEFIPYFSSWINGNVEDSVKKGARK